MEKKNRPRKYDDQFKEEALRQVANGQSVASVARSLGISEALLYQWRHRSKEVGDSSVNEQLESLRKQVKQLEAERDILKKALTIFSRPI
ncbi:MAG: transposase [Cyclobacteriaceae bacterium]|jgi:transposase